MISFVRRRLARFLPPPLSALAHSIFRTCYNMSDCIFCKIVDGAAPAQILYQDDQVTAFRDRHPVAPTHILLVPNRHLPSLGAASPEDEILLGRLLLAAKRVADQQGLADSGYRLIINNGRDANQVVFHLHLHLIGGQRMKHPLG